MDKQRATEITHSNDMIDVTYDGRNIYIEQVNAMKETASIHFVDQPQNSQEVHLTQLVETR